MKTYLGAVTAFLILTAAHSYGQSTTTTPSNNGSVNGPSDTVANGVTTGKTTTGSTPPSPNIVTGANSPAAASSGAPVTSPTGTYKGTGSSPQNQATGDVNANGTATKQ